MFVTTLCEQKQKVIYNSDPWFSYDKIKKTWKRCEILLEGG